MRCDDDVVRDERNEGCARDICVLNGIPVSGQRKQNQIGLSRLYTRHRKPVKLSREDIAFSSPVRRPDAP